MHSDQLATLPTTSPPNPASIDPGNGSWRGWVLATVFLFLPAAQAQGDLYPSMNDTYPASASPSACSAMPPPSTPGFPGLSPMQAQMPGGNPLIELLHSFSGANPVPAQAGGFPTSKRDLLRIFLEGDASSPNNSNPNSTYDANSNLQTALDQEAQAENAANQARSDPDQSNKQASASEAQSHADAARAAADRAYAAAAGGPPEASDSAAQARNAANRAQAAADQASANANGGAW